MRKILSAAIIALAVLVAPVEARNFAVPEKNPAITLSVPDDWAVQESEYGYSMFSPDKDVFFSVEHAKAGKIDAMIDEAYKWMKTNSIKAVEPKKTEGDLNGLPATFFRFDTSDGSGPTRVDMVLLNGGQDTLVMLTLWGSQEERKANMAAINGIMGSVKRIQ